MSDDHDDPNSNQGINIHAQKAFTRQVLGDHSLTIQQEAKTVLVQGDVIDLVAQQAALGVGESILYQVEGSSILLDHAGIHLGAQQVNFETAGGTVTYLARQGDFHHCPKTNSSDQSHVGGPIVSGSPNVLIDGRPAARVGDPLVCKHGPTDHIAQGNPTLIINGKAAAHLGHKTAHGGVIQQGSPTASGGVHIGSNGAEVAAPMMSQSHWGTLLKQHKLGDQL